MCDFKPGDEVVCVDASDLDYDGVLPLSEGTVYRVRAVVEHGARVGVLLHGIVWWWAPGLEGGYLADRFRKVQRCDLQAWLKTAVDAPQYDKRRVDA